MTDITDISQPPDICLLLRAYAEQRWLTTELLPHLRELELAHAIPDEQLGAALAYLEVLWLDAKGRASETDTAFEKLEPQLGREGRVLHERARRYYEAVRSLRLQLYSRVLQLTRPQEAQPELWCARL